MPDAAAYGDQGSNTLGHVAKAVPLRVPNLRSLGLGRIVDLGGPPVMAVAPAGLKNKTRPTEEPTATPRGAYGRMAEASPGKDSVTGHWEMMGIVLDTAFPTFPTGFPPDLISVFEERIGRGTIGNVVASGTEIIARLGAEHLRTGKPIVYTSADSVFQIAAHEAIVPVEELYRICGIAFDLAALGRGIGRVIARPFVGTPGAFTRTANRHDYALEPPAATLLDHLSGRGVPVITIGKVGALFAGRGITRAMPTAGDGQGMDRVLVTMRDTDAGLIFVNLVDFDAVYGHRNDIRGFADNLERFDERLAPVLLELRQGDLLVVTADHGNDPTTPGTDHSREHVPLLAAGPGVRAGVDLGTRGTFADLGQTIAQVFDVPPLPHGTGFLEEIGVHHP